MAAALSRSQIERLGRRLVADDGPTDEDLELLHGLLLARSEQLDRAEVRVRERLGIVPTSRVKNTETILEKLRRSGGSGLKSIQDLAGMRIVGDFDRRGQDDLAEQIVALFGDGDRVPKVVDADLIAAIEVGDMVDPDSPEVEDSRRLLSGDLVEMHDSLRSVAAIEATIKRLRQR